MKAPLSSLLPLAALLLAGCSHCPLCGGEWGAAERARLAASAAAQTPRIRTAAGTVTCLERVTILPTYRIRVRLVNLRTGETAATQEQTGFNGFPWLFSIQYDAKDLRAGDPFGLAAEVLADDAVLFRTDTRYGFPVEEGTSGANLVLVRGGRDAGRTE